MYVKCIATEKANQMAVKKSAAVKPKKKTVRATRRTTGMAAMPVKKGWDTVKYYVHYMVESREWGSVLEGYIRKHNGKETLSAISKLPAWKLTTYSHWATTAWLLDNGHERIVPDVYSNGLSKYIETLIVESKSVVAAKASDKKKNVHIPNIQERLMEAAAEKTEELEEWIDDFLRNPKTNSLKDKMPLDCFRKNEINLGHVRWIVKWYQGQVDELEELFNLPKKNLTDMEEQLIEGYSHLTKSQQTELYEFHKRIIQATEILRAEKNQSRPPRKVKQKSAADIVKKMKFKPSDPEHGIASVNPADVVGATTIVVFNCKNRKLGVYYAEDNQTIQVKGTTLQFFDEKRSLQKTIRKPDEVLPNWKKVTKHKLPSLFDFLTTTETKMNGRMNDDIIILKVFK